MARIFADRVKETTSTSSTSSTITLNGADAGFQAFSDVMVADDTCFYCEENGVIGQWETGIAKYVNATTLEKIEVIASDFSNQIVDFEAGEKRIYITQTSRAFQDISIKQENHVLSLNGEVSVTATVILSVSEAFGTGASSLVPIMTTNTLPSGVASASSEYEGEAAWKAFTRSESDYWSFANASLPAWLKYQFTGMTFIDRYTLRNETYTNYTTINTWEFQVSNNNVDWTTVDSQTGITRTNWLSMSGLYTKTLPAPVECNYARVYITAINSLGIYIRLYEMAIYGPATVQQLIPGTDYSVVRPTAGRGPQACVIKRLKAGTAIDHLVDYI